MKMIPKQLKNFINKFRINDKTGCWDWIGSIRGNNNYGQFNNKQAHRISFEIFMGNIPDGFEVCHKCDNTICVNPDHLFLGTHNDNMQDMIKKKRGIFPKGEKQGLSKLTEIDIINIRNSNMTQKELSEFYDVCRKTINDIKKRRTWKHVK